MAYTDAFAEIIHAAKKAVAVLCSGTHITVIDCSKMDVNIYGNVTDLYFKEGRYKSVFLLSDMFDVVLYLCLKRPGASLTAVEC